MCTLLDSFAAMAHCTSIKQNKTFMSIEKLNLLQKIYQQISPAAVVEHFIAPFSDFRPISL